MRRTLFGLAFAVGAVLVVPSHADPGGDGPTVPPPCTTEPCTVDPHPVNETVPGVDQTVSVPTQFSGTYQACVSPIPCTGIVVGPYSGAVRVFVPSYNYTNCVGGQLVWVHDGTVTVYTTGCTTLGNFTPHPLLSPPQVQPTLSRPTLCVFVGNPPTVYECV